MKRVILTWGDQTYNLGEDEVEEVLADLPDDAQITYELVDDGSLDPDSPGYSKDVAHRGDSMAVEQDRWMDRVRDSVTTEERYGWVPKGGPLGILASMVAPSTTEAIRNGREPSLYKEGLIDAGLAATALIPPLRAAAAPVGVAKGAGLAVGDGLLKAGVQNARRVARNAGLSAMYAAPDAGLHAGLNMVAEGANGALNDRFSVPGIIASGVLGGIGGGISAGLAGSAKRDIANRIGAEDGAKIGTVYRSLGSTAEGTAAALTERVPESLGKLVKNGDMRLTHQNAASVIEKEREYLGSLLTKDLISDVEYKAKNDLLKRADESLALFREHSKDGIELSSLLGVLNTVSKGDPEMGFRMADGLTPLVKSIALRSVKTGDAALDRAVPLYHAKRTLMRSYLPGGAVGEDAARAFGVLGDTPPAIAKALGDADRSPSMQKLGQMGLASLYLENTTAPKPVTGVLSAIGRVANPSTEAKAAASTTARGISRVAANAGKTEAPPSTDESGNPVYAPHGRQTWDWLWAQANKKEKK